MVLDPKEWVKICTNCAECHTTDWEQDPNYAHTEGTLEKSSGVTRYERVKHLIKWLSDLQLPALHGDMPPRKKLCLLFKHIEQLFLQPHIRGKRKHFLSYPFVIEKMIRIVYSADQAGSINYNFKPMKSKPRMQQHEDLWQKIVAEGKGFPTFKHGHNTAVAVFRPSNPDVEIF